jgi:hypothetical protein
MILAVICLGILVMDFRIILFMSNFDSGLLPISVSIFFPICNEN